MPSYKRVPSPSGDSGQWGTILNAHLAQTKNPANGSFNSFDTFATRPALTGFTQDDVGRSYLFTQTGNWHELAWNGTALYWKIQNHDNSQYANIKDYIYADLGVHDDTAAINTCLASFRKIYFPTGIYYAKGGLYIPSKTTIMGDGGTLSELRNVDTNQIGFIYSTNETNITIQGMYLNGNINRIAGGASSNSTYQISNTELAKEPRQNNIRILNCVLGGYGWCTLGANNAHYVLVDGCQFINGRDCHIGATTGCSNWTVVNCSLDETTINGIGFSNNGVSLSTYNAVDQVRNIIIANNRIKSGSNKDATGTLLSGLGIELDACRNVIVSNNIITITAPGTGTVNPGGGTYGIRIVASATPGLTNPFDNNDISIIGNVIINQSPNPTSGIELFNSALDTQVKHIKISDNLIRNEITSNHTGIAIYNLNRVIIENNIIKSATGTTLNQGVLLNVGVSGSIYSVDLISNDISGGSFAGVQCGGTNTTSPKVNFINNKVYNNATNLGFNSGWEFRTGNNYAPSPNYLDLGAIIHGDLRFYSNYPTSGTWILNEIVYNSNPAAGGYIGWVCISGGSPGSWKGFGLIQT